MRTAAVLVPWQLPATAAGAGRRVQLRACIRSAATEGTADDDRATPIRSFGASRKNEGGRDKRVTLISDLRVTKETRNNVHQWSWTREAHHRHPPTITTHAAHNVTLR
eukprot:COSAG05_NODE_2080_length_3601_cov_1.988007_4_plen_107_part_01